MSERSLCGLLLRDDRQDAEPAVTPRAFECVDVESSTQQARQVDPGRGGVQSAADKVYGLGLCSSATLQTERIRSLVVFDDRSPSWWTEGDVEPIPIDAKPSSRSILVGDDASAGALSRSRGGRLNVTLESRRSDIALRLYCSAP